MRASRALVFVTALTAAALLGPPASAAGCTVEQLPAGPATDLSYVAGIDAIGRIAGVAGPWADLRGVRWTGTAAEDLGAFGPGAVNRHGVLAGSQHAKATVWREGVTTTLPDLGHGAVANDINDRGDVVGQAFEADGYTQAVVWPVDDPGTMRVLADLPGASTAAEAIDNSGLIIGWSGLSTQNQSSMVWRTDGTVVGEYPAGVWFSDIVQGRIVGFREQDGAREAISMNAISGAITPIAGGAGGLANATNISGAVVGSVGDSPVWWARGKATALPLPPGAASGTATAISPFGSLIAGDVRDASWKRVAVVWRCG
ncbi:hypothetical protein [Amycolatopsis sp. YIM 10]|uniref:hypothetical protein n=1 Tax=Amycolatopsis sp. YIM 10 TaxID=2653857 RepID=UPI00128FDF50|nr:hypothetical protein [Amycolatopsis sp. YIM 10]QFU89001.1 hypothetical protein YIM_19110 [Amycolatopsis sp. YIM 10]